MDAERSMWVRVALSCFGSFLQQIDSLRLFAFELCAPSGSIWIGPPMLLFAVAGRRSAISGRLADPDFDGIFNFA